MGPMKEHGSNNRKASAKMWRKREAGWAREAAEAHAAGSEILSSLPQKLLAGLSWQPGWLHAGCSSAAAKLQLMSACLCGLYLGQ